MKLVYRLAVLIAFGYTTQSQACSYAIDELAKKNELGAQVLSTLQIGLDQFSQRVKSYTVENFKFFESISTPMCPKEMTYSMDVKVQYVPAGGGAFCFYNSKVTLVEGWGANSYKNFTVENSADSATCYYLGAL